MQLNNSGAKAIFKTPVIKVYLTYNKLYIFQLHNFLFWQIYIPGKPSQNSEHKLPHAPWNPSIPFLHSHLY